MSSAKIVRSVFMQLVLFMVVILEPASSHGADQRNFWVLNNTGKVIHALYVSPHERTTWGNDILGRETLPSGEGTGITFSSDVQTSCTMDFKLVFNDGTSQTYPDGRDVCRLNAVQFDESTSTGFVTESPSRMR